MLILDFLNVGDGDAILIRESERGYTVLVDTGRPHIEFTKGSKRRACINHLMQMGIMQIDLMVLTHLHFDHIGGALSVLRHIPVKRLMAAYLPPEDAAWILAPNSEEKTIVGMIDALNLFEDIVCAAQKSGTRCERATREAERATDALTIQPVPADDALLARQKEHFDAIYRGETMPEDALYAISKERNNSSLRLRLTYAGKRILLTGDSYAAYWEDDPEQPCDILKVPHHGDDKAMTQKLLSRLQPEYAVISCENAASPKKERPAPQVLSMLLDQVPHVLCTENRLLERFPATTQERIRIEIDTDGTITHKRI